MAVRLVEEDIKKVRRFEVIDETGRILVMGDVHVILSYQDESETLKVFIAKRGDRAPRRSLFSV